MTENIEANGYRFLSEGYTFVVFYNHQLNQEMLSQIQKYIPGWFPTPVAGCMTICVSNGQNQVGIYQVDKFMNLFAILPKFMNERNHLNSHILGILYHIQRLIRHWSTVPVANNIGYKIAFYRPPELEQVIVNTWPGTWRFTRNMRINICGNALPEREHSEYIAQWTFDDTFRVKTIGGWNTSTNPHNPFNRWAMN